MKVSEVIDRVSRDLVDLRNVRWSRPELLDFMNDAIAAIIIRRPDLSRTTATATLSSVNTLTLPADAYQILTVNHIDEVATQFVDINKLNQLYPDWRTKTGQPVCWTRNELDETTLFIYPKPTSDVSIEYVYSKNLNSAAETEDFPIPGIYEGVVVDFMMYRAYNKDGQNASEANKASLHFQAFAAALGDKASADSAKKQMIKESEGVR